MHTANIYVAAALFLSACGGDGSASIGIGPSAANIETVDSPDGALEAAFGYLKNKRVSAFVVLMAPPAKLTRMETEWAEMRTRPITEADDAEFIKNMSMFTADGAEEALFAKVQPSLAEAQQQLGMMAGMLPMMAAGAIQESGAPEGSLAMVESLGEKIAKMDISSEANAKKAIAIACKAARAIDVPNGAAMQKLSFDEALGKADIAYGAVMDVIAVYGIDFDSTFDSIDATILSTAGDTAEVEVSVSLFGLETKKVPVTMERADGRWFLKKDEEPSTPPAPGMPR